MGEVIPFDPKAKPTKTALADTEQERLIAVFRQLPDRTRALMHITMRSLAGLPVDPELARRAYSDPRPILGPDGGMAS